MATPARPVPRPQPASAERILQIAEDQGAQGISYHLFFYELDPDSYAVLKPVVDEYVTRGVHAGAANDEVVSGLGEVIRAARALPLFLFLDPCGLGLPFPVLAETLTGPRAARWPPTEVLLNFSLDAVRRIAGHVTSATPNEATMARLDEALGDGWWRDLVRQGVSDEAVNQIVGGFMERLEHTTRMQTFAIPVRRAPGHKPVYFLVLGTRSSLGIWHFADDTARATETWWRTLDAREAARLDETGQGTLFDLRPPCGSRKSKPRPGRRSPRISPAWSRAAAHAAWVTTRLRFSGEYLGRVRETVVIPTPRDDWQNRPR